MDNYSHMTRQEYRRLQVLKDDRLNPQTQSFSDNSYQAASWEEENKVKRLTRHLNRIIGILLIFIVVVYLILVFINF